jgi:hypothetical protein
MDIIDIFDDLFSEYISIAILVKFDFDKIEKMIN